MLSLECRPKHGLESERLMHPVIDQKGVDTQNEVVKEEKDYVLTINLMEI